MAERALKAKKVVGLTATLAEKIKKQDVKNVLHVVEVLVKRDQNTHLADLPHLLVVKRVTGVKNLKRGRKDEKL